MAYLPHVRVHIQGVIGANPLAPAEIWGTGFQLSMFEVGGLPSQSQVDGISAAYIAYHSSGDSGIQSNCYYKRCLVSAVDTLGNVKKDPATGAYSQRESVTAPVAGAGGGLNRPFQISSVVTLVTPRAGASGRGRMYTPMPVDGLSADGQASASQTLARAQKMAAFLAQVNSIMEVGPPTGYVAVASSAGFLSEVTSVRVGSVLDTQRRRRNALVEAYQTATV